ncbi:EAL domain-containing protein [Geomonas sp. Red69]|uniref:EAL domain-containing protein n=1 Tax=Geomonas diazotrophica TaxID=2843197 RepID=A0ABX8JPY5_9BACT|nr:MULTISPECIES: EAL domain-containing protein [Geomonas]MBU5635466.1 EAL domain-containing protein [Geomonas diazotrophica]QWV97485.1 EAL domain-containing protein [Geomonas nitrogeniifigens]QXE86624.1 EAL domain-containing protein [Geomonas nitrogeniifigens]
MRRPGEKFIRNLPLQRKLMLIIMGCCTATLFVSSLFFVAREAKVLYRNQQEYLVSLADMIGRNSAPALAFNDPKPALDTIRPVTEKGNILAVYILNKDGRLFVRYQAAGQVHTALPLEGLPDWASQDQVAEAVRQVTSEAYTSSFLSGYASVVRPIRLDGEQIGTVVIHANASGFLNSLRWNVLVALGFMAVTFLVFCLFSARLQLMISAPLLGLLAAMKEISASKNFALRVTKPCDDEIGLLYDGFNEMLHEIEERDQILRQRQAHLQQLAHYDPLTRLPNRTLFYDRLAQALFHAERAREAVAVIFIDLDHFKDINDTLGHRTGDLLLIEVAGRLGTVVRSCDTVARLGGDEFTIFCQNVANEENAALVAQKLVALFATPFRLGSSEIRVTASVGVTLFPHHGKTVDELLMNADIAMYHAKGCGKNVFALFDKRMNEHASERVTLLADLRQAVELGQFVLHYQPKVDLLTGKVTSVESLVRWMHPRLGMLAPDKFIRLAEESGMIAELTAWVLRTACLQAKAWQDANLAPVRVAVNLSPFHFQRQDVKQSVCAVLEATGLDPTLLEIEITESALMQNDEYTCRVLRELREMGITISVDDFGTGYSSLSYLHRFPINTLKIDRTFILNMMKSSEDQAIVTAIIAMAKSLKMQIVAEGVESVDQLEALKDQGCHEIQGFLVSRPVNAERVARFFTDEDHLQLQNSAAQPLAEGTAQHLVNGKA